MTTGRDIEARLRETFPDLPPDALRWLAEHPETIQWPEDVARRRAIEGEKAAESNAFWQWVELKYTPRQIETIQSEEFDFTPIWEHYMTRIVGTQWDVGFKPLIRQPEEFGLTTQDWRGLTGIMRDAPAFQAQLQGLIDTGRIDQSQAATIWNSFREQSLSESRAIAAGQQRTDFMRFATGQVEFPEDRARRLAEEEGTAKQAQIAGAMRFETAFQRAQRPVIPEPFEDFGPGLEELRTGFDIPQTERWRDWFRSRYPRLIEQFRAKPKEKQTEQTWAEFLKKRKPELREQFARLTPFQRGERPGVFAPKITTVNF